MQFQNKTAVVSRGYGPRERLICERVVCNSKVNDSMSFGMSSIFKIHFWS
mgnify:CR=1 FL=1